ncbi:MAG: glycosyltransferase family 2 protein [Bacteroidota bacterium]
MRISIITVVRNGEETIRDTINCVLRQSYHNIEYIIVDGNSTDNTLSIVKSFGSKIDKIISEPDTGIYNAMNKGLRAATGDYVAFLNADDFYTNTDVISQVVSTARETDADSIYGDLLFVDQNNINKAVRFWRAGHFDRYKMLFGWSVPHPTFFVKKSVFHRCGLFRENFGLSGDYEMMVRFFFKERISAAYIPQTLVRMRVGGAGNSGLQSKWKGNREDLQAWKQNGLKIPFFTILLKPLRKIPQFFHRPNLEEMPSYDLETSIPTIA